MKKQKIVLLMLVLGVAHVSVSVEVHMPEITGDHTTGEDKNKTTGSPDSDDYAGPYTTTSFSTQETPRSTAKPTTGTAELTSHTATTDDVPSRSGTANKQAPKIIEQTDTPGKTTKETIQTTNPEAPKKTVTFDETKNDTRVYVPESTNQSFAQKVKNWITKLFSKDPSKQDQVLEQELEKDTTEEEIKKDINASEVSAQKKESLLSRIKRFLTK